MMPLISELARANQDTGIVHSMGMSGRREPYFKKRAWDLSSSATKPKIFTFSNVSKQTGVLANAKTLFYGPGLKTAQSTGIYVNKKV